jgi:hypothetical protein
MAAYKAGIETKLTTNLKISFCFFHCCDFRRSDFLAKGIRLVGAEGRTSIATDSSQTQTGAFLWGVG